MFDVISVVWWTWAGVAVLGGMLYAYLRGKEIIDSPDRGYHYVEIALWPITLGLFLILLPFYVMSALGKAHRK